MKTNAKRWGFLMIAFLLVNVIYSQKKDYKMYAVHEDVVNPSMVAEYEAVSKEFSAVMNKYKSEVPDLQYLGVSLDNFKYLFVWPIANMADLDKNPIAQVRDKMGAEKFDAMMERMDKCYASHTTYTISMDPDLTYMPEGISQTQEGMNYREFHYYYTTPAKMSELAKKGKAISDLYASKNSPNSYRVYRSGFGTPESFFMVAISAKDAATSAQKADENYKLLGQEFAKLRLEALKYTTRFELYTGWIRPELSVNKVDSAKMKNATTTNND